MEDWPQANGQQMEGWPQQVPTQQTWQGQLGNMMSAQSQNSPQLQSQTQSSPSYSRLGYVTPDAKSLNEHLGIEQYGELNPLSTEGKELGLLNNPYHDPTALDYAKIAGNILAPTQGALYQMYGEESMGGQLENYAQKGLNFANDPLGLYKKLPDNLGSFMTTANIFNLFG